MQRSLSLSPQQKKELLAGRHYYLTKLRDVLQQRKALLATLEVSISELLFKGFHGAMNNMVLAVTSRRCAKCKLVPCTQL